jgi:hypothetical protein
MVATEKLQVCVCGKSYPNGATERDYLSEWDKRQWRSNAEIAILLFILLLIPVGLGYAAWHRQLFGEIRSSSWPGLGWTPPTSRRG